MAITEWLAVGALGLVFASNSAKNRERKAEEQRRKNTVCYFDDGITEEQFAIIAKKAAGHIKRVKKLSVRDTVVSGSVITQSRLSRWSFQIDFNDYGHITGKYWITSENSDSSIPNWIADQMAEMIKNFPKGFEEISIKCKSTSSTPLIVKFCPYCSKRISLPGIKFCPYCGKEI